MADDQTSNPDAASTSDAAPDAKPTPAPKETVSAKGGNTAAVGLGAAPESGGSRIGMSGPKSSGDPAGFNLPEFVASAAFDSIPPETLEMLRDVDLGVTIELGRTSMYVEDVLRLTEGSVVELDKLAGDPVDIYVNGRHVARGEILVLNDNFCVRVSEILAPLDEQERQAS